MRWVVIILMIVMGVAGGIGWRQAAALKEQNQALRNELEALRQRLATLDEEEAKRQQADTKRTGTEAQELPRLRGEVARLRAAAGEAEKLRVEVSALRAQVQQMRAAPPATEPPTAPTPLPVTPDQFPRQGWKFAGYQTPETALVSAIWAMKEGKPQVYLDSLSPEEQQRIAQTWQGKSEEEVAAKHRGDVGKIQSMRIVGRTPVSPTEVQMQVFLEGENRVVTARMLQQADQQWKFGGFVGQ